MALSFFWQNVIFFAIAIPVVAAYLGGMFWFLHVMPADWDDPVDVLFLGFQFSVLFFCAAAMVAMFVMAATGNLCVPEGC